MKRLTECDYSPHFCATVMSRWEGFNLIIGRSRRRSDGLLTFRGKSRETSYLNPAPIHACPRADASGDVAPLAIVKNVVFHPL